MYRKCSTHGNEEEFVQGFCGKLKGRRNLGRPKYRLKDNLEMHLRKVGLGRMEWIHLDQDRDLFRTRK
jgi:hypothetical protein